MLLPLLINLGMLGVHGKPYGNYTGYNDRGRSREEIEKERIRLGITKQVSNKLELIAKKAVVKDYLTTQICKEIKKITKKDEPNYLEFILFLSKVILAEMSREQEEAEEVLMLFNFME